MPRIEFRKRSRVDPASAYLRKRSRNVHSQAGEDGVIAAILEIMPPTNRWCVEFGAWDGIETSNTAALLRRSDSPWSGVLIEGSSDRFAKLTENYRGNERVKCISGYVRSKGPESLDAILPDTGAPSDLDLLSIDIDGNDYHVWNHLRNYRPRLLVIEFNPAIPNDVVYVQDDEPNTFQGSSLAAMIELGKQKGYELVATTYFNAFFVPAEAYPAFHIPSNDIDAMYDGQEYQTKFFQLYDGTLQIAGCQNLIWHNRTIDPEEIQVLPKSERRFPDKFRT